MAYLLLKDSLSENTELLLQLAQKLGVKISKVSLENEEDFLFGQLMDREKTDELVERSEVFKALND